MDISRHPKVVAIGEAGLDYHYDHSPRDVQKKSFRRISPRAADRIAARHPCARGRCRRRPDLEEETAKGAFPFVLHCFTSGADLAHRGLALGGYISFSGVVTFKKAEALRDIAMAVPYDRVLVETDAPYLAPEPFRGKTNEPAFMVRTAARLAAWRGLSEPEIGADDPENFFQLFGKVPARR